MRVLHRTTEYDTGASVGLYVHVVEGKDIRP